MSSEEISLGRDIAKDGSPTHEKNARAGITGGRGESEDFSLHPLSPFFGSPMTAKRTESGVRLAILPGGLDTKDILS